MFMMNRFYTKNFDHLKAKISFITEKIKLIIENCFPSFFKTNSSPLSNMYTIAAENVTIHFDLVQTSFGFHITSGRTNNFPKLLIIKDLIT
ncbi:hypothetical protein BpHYR1_010907 [Brachionus plicatilis]|uniref:Uncharacterized protein n=1 Tax=Brachionus plicatilis TaxID=10195 RepID=A0A3M7Q784_BRAPC|nr:hypothetical protein BpHYR1_010907 [Brachionus plicatilis]